MCHSALGTTARHEDTNTNDAHLSQKKSRILYSRAGTSRIPFFEHVKRSSVSFSRRKNLCSTHLFPPKRFLCEVQTAVHCPNHESLCNPIWYWWVKLGGTMIWCRGSWKWVCRQEHKHSWRWRWCWTICRRNDVHWEHFLLQHHSLPYTE